MVNKRLLETRGIHLAGSTLLLAASALAGGAAATEIFRWVDAEGTVHFGDRPPSDHPVQKIDVLPPPAAGPLSDGAELAPEQVSRPQAVIVPAAASGAD